MHKSQINLMKNIKKTKETQQTDSFKLCRGTPVERGKNLSRVYQGITRVTDMPARKSRKSWVFASMMLLLVFH